MLNPAPKRRLGLTRRELLAGLGALSAWGLAEAAPSRPLASGGVFPTGIRAGTPTPHGITLMAAVDDLDDGAALDLVVALDPDFARVILRRAVRNGARRTGFVRKRIDSSVLEPGREYWYRFVTRSAESPVGRFRTLRPADSAGPVRLGFFSCQGCQTDRALENQAVAFS